MNEETNTISTKRPKGLCAYCGCTLPEELEEIRRVFERATIQPTTWLVRRCTNPACQRRNYQPVSQQRCD